MPELVKYADHPKAKPGDACSTCDTATSMPVVDHCHVHGWVRGILCRRCNSSMSHIDKGFAPRHGAAPLGRLVKHAKKCPDCQVPDVASLVPAGTGTLRPASQTKPMSAESSWATLGMAVYRRRLELGIKSQRELATRAGVHHNTISKIELGQPASRRGGSWALIEAALEWPNGRIADLARASGPRPKAVPAGLVERVVFDAIAESVPDMTMGQAKAVACDVVARFERLGLLPSGPEANG